MVQLSSSLRTFPAIFITPGRKRKRGKERRRRKAGKRTKARSTRRGKIHVALSGMKNVRINLLS
jgi:hypothetical protein